MPLPTGTVTFLFTDLEGQTSLWEERPELMRAALARHDALLRQAVGAHGGQVVKTTGDGLHAAFARAPDALAAALAAQRALLAEAWELPRPLRARMGLHSGAAEERDSDYYGPAVNRAARVMQAGHGGQVLLSEVTAGLVRRSLPAGAGVRDLGEHRLKDLLEPEHLFLVADAIATEPPEGFCRTAYA
jgi:class 3 adenylate cyclase